MTSQTPPDDLVADVVDRFRRERPDIPSDLLEATSRLIVAGRLMQSRAARIIEAMGGHYTDFDVLGMLRTSGSPYEMTPAALMRAVMLTSGAMTACLNRMEQAGLVVRRIDTGDRRVRHVRLTAKGLAMADSGLSQRYEDASRILGTLDDEELAQLNALLERVSRAASAD